jgi:hypothetical protein
MNLEEQRGMVGCIMRKFLSVVDFRRDPLLVIQIITHRVSSLTLFVFPPLWAATLYSMVHRPLW